MEAYEETLPPNISYNLKKIALPSCTFCGESSRKIIKCYRGSSQFECREKIPYLCVSCVVGKVLPMYRRSMNQWDLGEVIIYDQEQHTHEARFPDGRYEMVTISSNPFRDYDNYLRYISNKENNSFKHDDDWDKHIKTPPSNHFNEFVAKNETIQHGIFKNTIRNRPPQYVVTPPNIPEINNSEDLSISLLPKRNAGSFTDYQDLKFNLALYQNEEIDNRNLSSYSKPVCVDKHRTFTSKMPTPHTSRDSFSEFFNRDLESDSSHSDMNFKANESCWEEMISCLDDKKDELEKGKQVYEQCSSRNDVKLEVINDSREPLIDTRYKEINSRVAKRNKRRLWNNRDLALTTNRFYDAPRREVSLESNEENEPRRFRCTKQRKTSLKLWTAEEDKALLKIVQTQSKPIKWPVVAYMLPSNRTGKQCRERYLNHLNPELKNTKWSCLEDATILSLYWLFGAQWAKMSSLLTGRTDNNIKNRFHHLRRKLEKDFSNSCKDNKLAKKAKQLQKEMNEHFICNKRESTTFQRKMNYIVGFTVAKILELDDASSESKTSKASKSKFQDTRFRKADTTGQQCTRCFLFLPSKQCGTDVCRVTGWCKTCTQIPTYLSRDALYYCLILIGHKR